MDIRCFIAVEIPEDLQERTGGVIDALRKSGADVKWVSHRNIHITLKFLGSTDEALAGTIKDALHKKISYHMPFCIRISGAGCFPDKRRPRVIWIGIKDTGELSALQKEIDNVMMNFGFPPEERPFSAHLTIGRVRSQKRMTEMLKALDEFSKADYGDIEIKGVSLMQSELKPGGAEYKSLAEILFEGRKDVK